MKKDFDKVIIISIVLIALIGGGLLVFLNNKDTNNTTDKSGNENVSNDNTGEEKDNSIKKSCKLVLDTNENATNNLVISYKVVDGIIMSATNNMLIECKTDEYYNSLKDYEDYAKNKEFNDTNKTIFFQEGEISDYSNLKIKYDEYKLDLEKNNYICD